MKNTKTVNPLPSLYVARDNIYRAARKSFAGGLCFGFDLPTWEAVEPISFAEWDAKRIQIAHEHLSLRSAGLHPTQTK